MLAVGLPQFEHVWCAPGQVRLLCPANPQTEQLMPPSLGRTASHSAAGCTPWRTRRLDCRPATLTSLRLGETVDRGELKAQIDELMRQYQDEEIDGETYARQMMDLTTSAQE
jgi:hypothetical protein